MLFTIFNYLPILEEETLGHRVEMAKKAKSGEPSGKSGDAAESDGDTDDSNESDIDTFYRFALAEKICTAQSYYCKHNSYRHLYANTITPPPKL